MSLVKDAQVRLENAMTQRPSHTLTMRAAVADVQAILSDRERLQSELVTLKEELDVMQDSRDRLEERRLKAERELAAARDSAREYIARTDPMLFCSETLDCGKCRACYQQQLAAANERVEQDWDDLEVRLCNALRVIGAGKTGQPSPHGPKAWGCICYRVREALRSTPANPTHQHETGCPKLRGGTCDCNAQPLAQEPKPLPHHCGLTGFNPMKDEPCPACVERHTYVPKTDQPGLDKCGFPVRRLVIGGRDVGYQHCGGPKSAHQPGKDEPPDSREMSPWTGDPRPAQEPKPLPLGHPFIPCGQCGCGSTRCHQGQPDGDICAQPKAAHQPGKDQAEGERRKAPPHPGAIGAIPPDWEDKRKAQPCGHPMSDQKSEGRCKHGCVYGCFSG